MALIEMTKQYRTRDGRPVRPSHVVAAALKQFGYRVIPAAPGLDEPLEILTACHGQVLAQLETPQRLLAHLPEHSGGYNMENAK